jgi:hypothetical protein
LLISHRLYLQASSVKPQAFACAGRRMDCLTLG